MPHIRELLDSSVLVIVRYHKAKLPKHPNTEADTRHNLLQMPHAKMISELTDLIHTAVTTNDRDEARRPLLMYVLHHVDQIRSFVDSQTPLEDEAINLLEANLTQFIANIQCLLLQPQRLEKTFSYNQKEVKLYGLMRGAINFYSLCTSGAILQDTLFSALLLPTDASPDNMKRTITDMISHHQRHLILTSREIALKFQENELVDLRKEVAATRRLKPTETDAEGVQTKNSKQGLVSPQLKQQQGQPNQANVVNRPGIQRFNAVQHASPFQNTLHTSSSWANFFFFAEQIPRDEGAVVSKVTVNESPVTEQPQDLFNVSDWF